MSPWWQRPTSEGAANEEKQEQEQEQEQDKTEQTPAMPAIAEGDAASRSLSESVEGVAGSHRADDTFRTGRTGDAGAAVPAAPAAGAMPEAEPAAAHGAETSHQAQLPGLQAPSAYPEPYRAFWQPREPAPPQEAAPGPVEPAAAAVPTAAWRTPEGTDLGSVAVTAPPAAEPALSEGDAGHAGQEPAARARHEPRGPRPIAAPFQPAAKGKRRARPRSATRRAGRK